jgi:flagellar biosynthesis protein FlhB
MSGEDDDDKQFDASQKKLDDARKKGEVPKSTDLMTSASYGGFLLIAGSFGAASLTTLASTMSGFLGKSDSLSTLMFSGSGRAISGGMMLAVLQPLAPWFLVPALAVILAIIAQRSFVVAPDKLIPKLSRISMLSNAKNKFGRSGLFEFGKSFVKLLIYGTVLWIFLMNRMPEILATMSLSPGMVAVVLVKLSFSFLSIVLMISLSIGAVDYLFQQQEHARKNRMSHQEVKDEAKQSEGDPHMKQKRRQKGYEIAMNQMIAAVPEADVIIVNPTHYAVALKWDRASGAAPICVAKGVDEIAAKIREVASENGIAIHRDPPTARALYAVVEVDQEIWPEHYQAVAAAIRFAEKIRKHVRMNRSLK